MPYSDKILEHYNNPRNVGSFTAGDATVGTGLVGAPRVRRRHEAANQGEPGHGPDRRCTLQNLRLRQRDCVEQPGHRMAQGQKSLDEALAIKNTSDR